MTDQHRATPEEWEYIRLRAEAGVLLPNCLLELRARIESLEAAPQDKLDRLIALDREDPTPDPAMAELRAASAEAQPGGLVERVANAISGEEFGGWHPEARDAIREVAKWLEKQQEVPIGSSTACAGYFAAMLREEADRG